jgi:hypothetical protein
MRRPRLTDKVLRGVIAATGNILAGRQDGECESDWSAIERANEWAHDMRAFRRNRKRSAEPEPPVMAWEVLE